MKTFKKFIPVLVILAAALAIFVQNRFFSKDYGTLVAENSKYRIWKTEEGSWLLTMYHFPKFSEDRRENRPITSVAELRQRILTGDIPKMDLEMIRRQTALRDGVTEILDLDALREVCLPTGVGIQDIYWSGDQYYLEFGFTGKEETLGQLNPPCYDPRSYEEQVEEERQQTPVSKGGWELREYTMDGRTVEVLKKEDHSSLAYNYVLRYEAGTPGQRIHVWGYFGDWHPEDPQLRELYYCRVIYENQGAAFSVTLNSRFGRIPTPQWLEQFGFVPLPSGKVGVE